MDVIHGDAWYEAPTWKMHPIRELKDRGDGAAGYSNSFANWTYDLNGDGWADLICIDFPGELCYWFENPKNEEGHWKKHPIWHSAANETPQFLDLTGDGKPELIMASETEGMVGYLEIPAGEKVYKWAFTAVSPQRSPSVRTAITTAWEWETSIGTAGSTLSSRTAGGKGRRRSWAWGSGRFTRIHCRRTDRKAFTASTSMSMISTSTATTTS